MPVLFEGVAPKISRDEYARVKHAHLLDCLEALRHKGKAVAVRVGAHLAEMAAAIEHEHTFAQAQKRRLDAEEVRATQRLSVSFPTSGTVCGMHFVSSARPGRMHMFAQAQERLDREAVRWSAECHGQHSERMPVSMLWWDRRCCAVCLRVPPGVRLGCKRARVEAVVQSAARRVCRHASGRRCARPCRTTSDGSQLYSPGGGAAAQAFGRWRPWRPLEIPRAWLKSVRLRNAYAQGRRCLGAWWAGSRLCAPGLLDFGV